MTCNELGLHFLCCGDDDGQMMMDITTTDLCIKLAQKNKDDLRVPFRVLKDEIGRCEYTSEASIKEKQVDLLFKVCRVLCGPSFGGQPPLLTPLSPPRSYTTSWKHAHCKLPAMQATQTNLPPRSCTRSFAPACCVW